MIFGYHRWHGLSDYGYFKRHGAIVQVLWGPIGVGFFNAQDYGVMEGLGFEINYTSYNHGFLNWVKCKTTQVFRFLYAILSYTPYMILTTYSLVEKFFFHL